MDGQSQVCNLNGPETFKLPKNLKSFTDSIDSPNTLRYERKSDFTNKFSNAVNDSSEEKDTDTTNGLVKPKVIPKNAIFGPKKNSSNRLSCAIDYRTTTELNKNGSLKRNKLSGRLGLGVSSNSGQQMEKQKCFLCDKEGVTKVREGSTRERSNEGDLM